MTLSILILNYKTKGLLKQCLRGVTETPPDIDHEVIVIDNNSRDGSLAMVRDLFPTVIAIGSPRNVGFAAGMNLGFARAQGDYVLILNPDVALFPSAVKELLDYMADHPQVGIAGPKLINPDGTVQWSCYQFPSRLVPLLRRSPFGRLPPARRLLKRFLMSDWDHHDNRAVGWLLGGCMLIRRQALDQVGQFDPRFFLYFEDVDLCRRMWQNGWEVHYVASAEMVHYHQRMSAGQAGLAALFSYPTRVHIRSWLLYEAKFAGLPKPPHAL